MAIPSKLSGREQQDILKRRFNLTSREVTKLRSSAIGFWGKKLGKTMPTSQFSKVLGDLAETSEGTFIGDKLKNAEREIRSYLKNEAKKEREQAALEAKGELQTRGRAYGRGIEIRKEIRKREEERAQREAERQEFFNRRQTETKPKILKGQENLRDNLEGQERINQSEKPVPPPELPLD